MPVPMAPPGYVRYASSLLRLLQGLRAQGHAHPHALPPVVPHAVDAGNLPPTPPLPNHQAERGWGGGGGRAVLHGGGVSASRCTAEPRRDRGGRYRGHARCRSVERGTEKRGRKGLTPVCPWHQYDFGECASECRKLPRLRAGALAPCRLDASTSRGRVGRERAAPILAVSGCARTRWVAGIWLGTGYNSGGDHWVRARWGEGMEGVEVKARGQHG